MIGIKRKITNFINNFCIPKKYRADYYLQTLISEKVNFDKDRIKVLFAKKTNMKKFNKFNYFIFKYKGKLYKLIDNELTVINNIKERK